MPRKDMRAKRMEERGPLETPPPALHFLHVDVLCVQM